MGRYSITLKLKHMAIYFSDSSHRFPPPPRIPSLSFLAQRRFAVSRWDEKTYVAKVLYIPQTSPNS